MLIRQALEAHDVDLPSEQLLEFEHHALHLEIVDGVLRLVIERNPARVHHLRHRG
jgi:hypothetical protein